MQSPADPSALQSQDKVLYKTFSVCPICTLIERTGVAWQPASVVKRDTQVWLLVHCKTHGNQETHYCSNAKFFKDVLSFAPAQEAGLVAIEDLMSKINISPTSESFPLVVELAIFQEGSFLSDEDIEQEVKRLQSLYPEGRKFVLKILGKLSADMGTLNKKVLFVEKLLPATPLLLEVSFDRLVLLCQLPDSVFLRPWIYPALKYFLRKGDEALCKEELMQLIDAVQAFSDIQLVITLSVSRPFPQLQELLSLLRENYSLIRFIVISLERPPKQIIASAQLKHRKAAQEFQAKDVKQKHQTNVPIDTNASTSDKQIEQAADAPQMKRMVVPSGAKGRIEVRRRLQEVGCKLRWSFRTEEKDIAFGIAFSELANPEEVQDIQPIRRYASHQTVIEGELIAHKIGYYRLRWDNSYSRFRSKTLHYATYVDPPGSSSAAPSLSSSLDGSSSADQFIGLDTLDPFELLQSIESATERSIAIEGRVFEPFVGAIGYGKFTIQPSPFCGFATCLMNIEDMKIRSVPISRFIDFKKFYFAMLPHLKELEKQSLVHSLLAAGRVKKIISKCSLKSATGGDMPDIVSYFTDSSKAAATQRFIRNTQFLVVHNTMDIAALDLRRRCHCTVVTSHPGTANSARLAASCAGCI